MRLVSPPGEAEFLEFEKGLRPIPRSKEQF